MLARFRNIRNAFRWIGFYIPFTWYFCLFFIASLIGYSWLQNKAGIPDSAYKDIFALLLEFSIWFCIVFLVFAFLSTFIPFLYFAIKNKKNGIDFRISTPARGDSEDYKQTINLFIQPILKPLLGFVKLRLRYDEEHFSDKFSILKRSEKKFFSTTLNGIYYWQLPEIKEYQVNKALVYFEDFFQFFSFALPLNTSNSFHTQPVSKNIKPIQSSPRKTEDTSIRIEELKRVEGEHINYKNFESNDDVRRIVWKIYAKNKELVVRIPEILDPYASEMHLFASYYSFFDIGDNEVIRVPFLNYYKIMCWTIYKQICLKGFDVKYVPDQDLPATKMENADEQVKFNISVSKWHREKELRDFVKPKQASVVILSSLSDPDQVKELMDNHGNEISFIFVPLTDGLNKQNFGHWLQWIFLQEEKDQVSVYKTNWSLSLLRLKIIKNEKAIKELLDQYDRNTILQKTV